MIVEKGPPDVNGSADPEPVPEPPDDEALIRTAGFRLRIGAAIAFVVTVLLAMMTELSFVEVVALPVFLVLLPTMAIAQAPFVHHFVRVERIAVYLGSGFAILVTGGVAMTLIALGPGAEAAGIVFLPAGELAIWSGALTVGAVLLSLGFRPVEMRIWRRSGADGNEGDDEDSSLMDALLPRTPEERRLFAGLSIAAGWGEEMAYRGYVPAALALVGLGAWPAMIVATGAFGFLHAYQGASGVVRTATLGLLLGASVILTGSIFPAMIAHALVDIILGLIIGPYLLERRTHDD